MARKDIELNEMLKRAVGEPNRLLHGIVEDVDTEECTCTINSGGQIFRRATLRSVASDDIGVVFFPRVNSVVFAIKLPNSSRLHVIAISECESFHIKIDDTEISGNGDGIILKRAGESLKKILSDTFDAIVAMTVTTGVGPSGTPINFADFQSLKNRLNDLLIQ